MSKVKFDIRSGTLFPWHFRLVGALIVVLAVVIIVSKTLISFFLFIAGLFVLISFSGFEIDLHKRTYRSYYALFYFFKIGKPQSYKAVEKIYINANQVTQKIYSAHTTQSSTFKNIEYDAYLKFDNGNKEYLCSSKKLDELKQKINPLAEASNLSITDNT